MADKPTTRPTRWRRSLGMSPLTVCGLAALGVPRVIAHDLDLVGPVVNSVLVYVPLGIWVAVVLWKRVPNQFRTLLAVGLIYGVLLALTHQLLWAHAFDGASPSLGGNLEGTLAPAAEEAMVRAFAFVSSLVTGTLVGAASGLVAWLLARAVPAFRARS